MNALIFLIKFFLLISILSASAKQLNKKFGYVNEKVGMQEGPDGEGVYARRHIYEKEALIVTRNGMMFTPEAAVQTRYLSSRVPVDS